MKHAGFFFDANIWGTVSDWCMVAVTTTTAYYLYKTLQSQKDVQKTQAKLYEIESVRFRESIKPKLRYTLYTGDTGTFVDKPDKEILTIEVTNETTNLARAIRPIYNHDNEEARPVFSHPNPKHHEKGDKPIYLHFVVDRKPKLGIYFSFAVAYKDVSGTIYKQGIICIKDYGMVEINPYLPEIITPEEFAKLPII
jgi:hypothetical protein